MTTARAAKAKRERQTNPNAPKKGDKALAALAEGASLTAAAAAEGVRREVLWAWRKEDPAFDAAVNAAIDAGTDKLEDIAKRRASETSDTLLIFLLKGRRPEKYRERHTVEGGEKPVEIVVTRRIVEPGGG